DRVEISPVLRLILGADQVRQITAEYARMAAVPDATDPALRPQGSEPADDDDTVDDDVEVRP
ncbi:hypothetical protein VTU32_12560, partial [Thermoanaerobacter sp. CM-CNRG TB177]